MRVAFLILAHNNPAHLGRLITALSHQNTHCFLHIDKKSTILPATFRDAPSVSLSNNRYKVYWGDFSMIMAILALIEQAVQHPLHFDRLVLLSGADYPVKPIDQIVEFFIQNGNREYINITRMPDEEAGKPLRRLTRYKIHEGGSLVHRLTFKILSKAGLAPQTRPYADALGSFTPYGGSTWWALTREACLHIIDVIERNPSLYKYFRNTHYPDEMLFHTILGNSPFQNHISRNLTYTDWRNNAASPEVLTVDHLPTLTSGIINQGHDAFGTGPMLFARKFNDDSIALVEALS